MVSVLCNDRNIGRKQINPFKIQIERIFVFRRITCGNRKRY